MSLSILGCTIVVGSTLVASFPAWSQTAEVFSGTGGDKPLRVIVTTAPGSGIDQLTRPIAETLSRRIARPVVVDNRPGANGVIGGNVAAGSTPDGMTLISTSNSFIINGVLKRFPFDLRRVFVPVAQVSSQHYLMLCPVALPISDVAELVDYARKNPGKMSFGSGGVASVAHLGMELIEAKAKIVITHVPYKSNALAGLDLTAGRIQLMFSNVAGTQMVRAGKAKVIAVTTPKRMPAYPDVPTMAESGFPGYELSNTYTLYTLAQAPSSIVAALNREIVQILGSPDLKARFAADSAEVAPPYTPAELRKLLLAEHDKWDAVVKAANIAAELAQ